MTVVINLYGGPGTGKSTTAALLFGALKSKGVNCELVTEYAKDIVWEGIEARLKDQIYVFAEQHHKIFRLIGKVDFVITDSPVLLSAVYGQGMSASFRDLVLECATRAPSYHIFLNRIKDYNPAGRLQDEVGARKLDAQIKDMLFNFNIKHTTLDCDENIVDNILEVLE